MGCLTLVPIRRLYEFWPWVRDGLLRVQEKSVSDWIPEDIYLALRTGAATLYVIGEAEDGFIVLQRQERARGSCLFVWAIAGELKAHEQALYAELDRLGREIGAATIEMQSTRDGWGRRGYFEPRCRVYVRTLQEN